LAFSLLPAAQPHVRVERRTARPRHGAEVGQPGGQALLLGAQGLEARVEGRELCIF
jgi:hypothetical protein